MHFFGASFEQCDLAQRFLPGATNCCETVPPPTACDKPLDVAKALHTLGCQVEVYPRALPRSKLVRILQRGAVMIALVRARSDKQESWHAVPVFGVSEERYVLAGNPTSEERPEAYSWTVLSNGTPRGQGLWPWTWLYSVTADSPSNVPRRFGVSSQIAWPKSTVAAPDDIIESMRLEIRVGSIPALLRGELDDEKVGDAVWSPGEQVIVEKGTAQHPYVRERSGDLVDSLSRIVGVLGIANETLSFLRYPEIGISAICLSTKAGERFVPLQPQALGLLEQLYSRETFVAAIQKRALRRHQGAIREQQMYGDPKRYLEGLDRSGIEIHQDLGREGPDRPRGR